MYKSRCRVESYKRGDNSEDLLYWMIAGHVATGQMKKAREIARHARKLGIAGSRIVIIDAILAYSLSDYDRSERLLSNLLESDPDDCVAKINLAVILLEQDKTIEARDILGNIVDTCPDTNLQTRARTLLANQP